MNTKRKTVSFKGQKEWEIQSELLFSNKTSTVQEYT